MKKRFVLWAALAALCLWGSATAESAVLRLPDNAVRIEAEAFAGDVDILRVEIPGGVEFIGDRAFADCTGLLLCDMTAVTDLDITFGADPFPENELLLIYVPEGMGDAARAALPQYADRICEAEDGVMGMWFPAAAGRRFLKDAEDPDSYVTGWQSELPGFPGKWFYFGDDGVMRMGWQTDIAGYSGKWFYFGTDGMMRTGWQSEFPGFPGEWFYFGTDGVMRTGWQNVNDDWYYFGDDGVMRTGSVQIDGEWYEFGATGKWIQN